MASGSWLEIEKKNLSMIEKELAVKFLQSAGQYPKAHDGFRFDRNDIFFYLHVCGGYYDIQAVSCSEPVGPALRVSVELIIDLFDERMPVHVIPKDIAIGLIGTDWPLGSPFDWNTAHFFGVFPAGQFGDCEGGKNRLVIRAVRDMKPVGPPLAVSSYIPEGFDPGEA